MKNDNNKIPLATEIIREQKYKIIIYRIISILLTILTFTLLFILLKRGWMNGKYWKFTTFYKRKC